MENLQQQLRNIETEHQARVAAWKQQGGGMQQDDAGGRRSRWDKTAPMGGKNYEFDFLLNYNIIFFIKRGEKCQEFISKQ